jgi:hypothetical protein
MVHIGGAIASELTWMHGRSPTRKRSVPAPQSWWETWRDKLKQLTPKAWIFVSEDHRIGVNPRRNALFTNDSILS